MARFHLCGQRKAVRYGLICCFIITFICCVQWWVELSRLEGQRRQPVAVRLPVVSGKGNSLAVPESSRRFSMKVTLIRKQTVPKSTSPASTGLQSASESPAAYGNRRSASYDEKSRAPQHAWTSRPSYSSAARQVTAGHINFADATRASSQMPAQPMSVPRNQYGSTNVSQVELKAIMSSLPKEQSSSVTICRSPDLPLFTPFIRAHRPTQISPNICHSKPANWLQIRKSRVQLRPEVVSGLVQCIAEPIIWKNDTASEFGPAELLNVMYGRSARLPSLGFRAQCLSSEGKTHRSIYYGVHRLPSLQPVQRQEAQPDNIVILGMDSMSRLETLRSLANASHLIESELGGVTLRQYNIMGDGTPAALLPILTGIREEDMPESRRGFKGARHLDEGMRWLFRDLKERGFVSLYGEEGNSYGTWQLRFLGFKEPPVDFYLRPTLLREEREHVGVTKLIRGRVD